LKNSLKNSLKKGRKNYKLSEGRGGEGREGGREGGWRIVIPMPEAINFVQTNKQTNNQSSRSPRCNAGI
jgi:hypothetical protein